MQSEMQLKQELMDKNETLLDYAKDNMDNNEEKDARVASLE